MTIPAVLHDSVKRVSDMVLEMFPGVRDTLTPQEQNLRVHLSGNERLYTALHELVVSRIGGRAQLPLPSDPLQCYGSMARDKELQWLLGRLAFLYHAPVVDQRVDDGEQPDE